MGIFIDDVFIAYGFCLVILLGFALEGLPKVDVLAAFGRVNTPFVVKDCCWCFLPIRLPSPPAKPVPLG